MCIVKSNGNWLLVFKNSARRGFLALVYNGKIILGPREEKVGPTRYKPNTSALLIFYTPKFHTLNN
jgi:hypothetical protein